MWCFTVSCKSDVTQKMRLKLFWICVSILPVTHWPSEFIGLVVSVLGLCLLVAASGDFRE